ncbi:MAG: NADPH-dependent F420 reductase [Sphingobacteriales bacterium]
MKNNKPKIGIIGSGIVGRVLATAFLKEGYEVSLGTRDTGKDEVAGWKTENALGNIGTFKETAAFGEILVLAVAGSVAIDVVNIAGKENFSNKVIVDATNPISKEPPVNGVLKFFTDLNESLMEKIQQVIPQAKLVKAFNSVGNALMYKPNFSEGVPTMFIAGNDAAAKKTVTGILTAFGWETEDMGKAEAARAIEPLCILWCIPGFISNQWTHAFKLLRK